MKYKTYRICLLSLVILAVVGGIFYYRNVEQNQLQTVDGTFVETLPAEGYMTALEAFGRSTGGDPERWIAKTDDLVRQIADVNEPEAVMDAFCRKVAAWEDYADGEAYGGR
jgi:hypothetical protein